ncbi:DUF445 domain-containing protein [Conexibacter sp. DBS9H8]|uniref:DUF445 domain-containing protein n=1 Tax=Conexibacter sp. DBS9H8 TaxID=2937801 RepID=UPI00200F1451|nr:hypothetical protein [Conexibacter sp. DBS9H8]
MSTSEWIRLATIPFFTGAIGWLINWTGLIMLFQPVKLYGVRIPGLRDVATLLPRKLQEIPGWMEGRLGWQGIVPARAAKMGSIAVDKAIAKLGTPAEFYQQLEPDEIARKIVEMFGPEVPRIVDESMWREQPGLWGAVPPRAKQAVYDRVTAQLPVIVKQITDEIGEHIDLLLDPKLMVIDHFSANPALVNRIFQDVGQRELRLMVNFGFLFGFLFGIPVAAIIHFFPDWWLLPILGVIVGWITNLLGMFVIFEPVNPRYVFGIKIQGLFLRRQNQVADVYAQIIADDVVTLENIGNFLLTGPRADRTRQMLESAMGPAIDLAAGPARAAVRVAVGTREYDSIRSSVAQQSVAYTMTPFLDPEFSREQSDRIRTLIAARTREMAPRDFVEMLRAAIKEDEWMLYLHGALMGLAGGFIHLLIFGA